MLRVPFVTCSRNFTDVADRSCPSLQGLSTWTYLVEHLEALRIRRDNFVVGLPLQAYEKMTRVSRCLKVKDSLPTVRESIWRLLRIEYVLLGMCPKVVADLLERKVLIQTKKTSDFPNGEIAGSEQGFCGQALEEVLACTGDVC